MSRLIKPIWPNLEPSEKKVITIKKMVGTSEREGSEKTVETIENMAADLLQNAREEAERILREAKIEYQSVKEEIEKERNAWMEEREIFVQEAKEEGYQSGWNEGRQQGYSEYRKLLEEARAIIASAKNDYTSYLESSEKVILDMGMKIAEKITAKKIEEEEYFLSLVKKALKEAKESRDIRLHVHPQSYEFILSQKENLLFSFPQETSLFVFPDEEMPPGGCVIESETGRIDAGIDTQLSEIKRVLTDLLESEAS